MENSPRNAKQLLAAGLEKALLKQQPLARQNVERLRRVHPHDSPRDVSRRLTRYYLASVTMSGGAAGAAALVPGAGIPAALADVLAYTEASVLYLLSLVEIHDLHPEDIEARKRLVLTVLLGEGAVGALDTVVKRTGPYWGRRIVESIPMAAINRANKVLGPRFITKYGTKQGVLVLGKQAPVGFGALIGSGGNHIFARLTVRSARQIFGPLPDSWPDDQQAGSAGSTA